MNNKIVTPLNAPLDIRSAMNPTPSHTIDIRKVNKGDKILGSLIEEHKHAPQQVSLFG